MIRKDPAIPARTDARSSAADAAYLDPTAAMGRAPHALCSAPAHATRRLSLSDPGFPMSTIAARRARFAALLIALCLAGGVGHAELFNAAPARTIGPFSSGQVLPQPGGGWTAADDPTIGASIDGQGGWAVTCTAARYDQEITAAQAHSGIQSWRVSNWYHEGCVNTVLSRAFASVQEGAGPTSLVSAEYWFRVPADNDGLVVSSSLGDAPGARLTYAAIRDSGGSLTVQTVGIVQGSGWTNTDPPPFDDAGVRYDIRSSGALAHDTWYRLRTEAQLVPGARNDVITYSVFDADGATVWTSGAMDSWEDAYLAGPFAAPGTKVTLTRLGFRLVENPDDLGNRNPPATYALNRPTGVYIDDLSVTPGSGSAISAGFEADRYVANGGSDSGDCAIQASPCATISYAITQALQGNTIHIASGSYDENVVVATPGLRLLGEGPTRPVLTRTAGSTNQALLYVNDVRDVRIENLHFAADKTFVAEAVVALGDIEGLRVSGNRFVSSQSGVAASTFRFTNAIAINHVNNTVGGTIRDGRSVLIEDNLVEATGTVAFRAGIQLDRGLGVLRGNTIVANTHDLIVRFPTVVPGVSTSTSVTIEDNHLLSRGAQIASPNAGVSGIVFRNNEVRALANADTFAAAQNNPADFSLMRIVHNDAGVPLTVSGNLFLDHAGGYRGVLIQNWPGVLLANNVFTPRAGASDFVSLVVSNKEITTDPAPSPPQPFALIAQGNTFNAASAANVGRAVEFIDDNDASGAASYGSLVFGGNSPGDENSFGGRHQRYFRLDDHSCNTAGSTDCGFLNYPGVGVIPNTQVRPFAGDVSASGNRYDGQFPADMSAAEQLALRARTYDDDANPALGNVDYGFSGTETATYVDDGYAGQSYGAALSFSHAAVAPDTVYYGINAFATITDAITHTQTGGTVYIAKGSYGATLVDRFVNLIGDGNGPADTVVAATLTIGVGGTSPGTPLQLRDLRVSGAGNGIVLIGSQSHITLERVSASGNGLGGMVVFASPLPTLTQNLRIIDSHFDDNGDPLVADPQGYVQAGFLFAEDASVDGLHISGSTFNGNSGAGFSVNSIGAPASTAVIQNVLIETSEFSRNAPIGASPSGTDLNYTGGGGIWLKTSGAGSVIRDVTVRTSLFEDNGSGRINPAPVNRRINANGITLRARINTTLDDVRLCDNTFRENAATAGVQEYGIYAYDQTSGGWPVDAVELCGTNTFDGLLEGVSGFEQFANTGTQPVITVSGPLVATHGGVARAYANDPVRRYADALESGAPALHGTIAAAVAAAAPGNAIVLGEGRFRESVTIPDTLDGLVLRGTLAGSQLVSEINGASVTGVRLPGNGVSVTGARDVTIKQLRVTNFDGSCVLAMPGGGDEPHGLRVGDASLPDVDPEAEYDAAHYTTELSHCGTSGGIGGGVMIDVGSLIDDVRISHVSLHHNQRRGVAVWDARKTNFELDNNYVANNGLAGMELLDGAASGVVMRHNLVIGNGDAGLGVLGAQGPGVTHIHHNRVQDNGRFGITLNNPNGSGRVSLAADSGTILVEDNHVLRTAAPADGRDLSGIAVIRRARDPAFNVDVPFGVVVRDNTVDGITQPVAGFDGYGIVVEGAQSRIEGNSVSGSDIAIQRQAGNTPAPPADGDQAASNDYFGRGNSQYTCATIGSNTIDGTAVSGTNGTNGSSVRDVDLRPGAASMTAIVTNGDTGRTFCSLAAALADPTTLHTHTLRISDGVVLSEQVDVTKRVRITRSGIPGAPNAPVLATPASVSGAPALLRVQARDVTIDNLEFRVDLDRLGTAIAALPGGETPSGLVIQDNHIQAIDSDPGNPAQAPFAQRHAISLNGRGYAPISGALSGFVVRGNVIDGSDTVGGARVFGSGIEFDDSAATPPVPGPPSLATDGITPVLWLDDNTILAGSQDANLRYSNGRVLVTGNTFNGAGLEVGEAQGLFEVDGNTFAPSIPALRSLGIKSVQHGNAYLHVAGNSFAGHAIGVAVQNSQSWHLLDNTFAAPASGDFVHLLITTKVFGGAPLAFARIEADVRGNTFESSGATARGVAVLFADHDYRASRPAAGLVRLGGASAGSPDANRFRGAFAHYVYLDPSDCPSSTTSAGCTSGAAPPVYASYGSTVMRPFPVDVFAADNGFVATNPGTETLPRDMSAAQIADLQARTYHDDPLAPEVPPGAPAALGRVEFGFQAPSVALSVIPAPANDGRTQALQHYAVRVQNSGGAVPEPVKLRYAITRATTALPSANQPMGGDVLQDEPAADSVRSEFADPGCLASNGHVENGWCLSRLNPAGGGIALGGEFPQINNGFPVDVAADFSGATRSLFRLPGTYATVLQAVGHNSGTVYASTNFTQGVQQPLAVSYTGTSAIFADGAALPLSFTVAPTNDLNGAALAGKVALSYSASPGPNDGSPFATGAAAPTLAGGYAVTASANDSDYLIDPAATTGYAVTRKPISLSVSGALTTVYSGQPQGLSLTPSQPLSGAPMPGSIAVDYTLESGPPAPSPPVDAGSHAWTATVDDPNLSGTLSAVTAGNWVITRATPSIVFANLSWTYNGTPRAASAGASCSGAISASAPACDGSPAASLRYGADGATGTACASGSATPPGNVGSYEVCATIDSGNYYAQATATLTITGSTTVTDLDGPATGVESGRAGLYRARLDNTAAAALPSNVRFLLEITRSGGAIVAGDLFSVQADEGSGGSFVAAENFGVGPNGGLLFKLDGPLPDAGYGLAGDSALVRQLLVYFATVDTYTLHLTAQRNDGTVLHGVDSVTTMVAAIAPNSDTQLILNGPTGSVETGADTGFSARLRNGSVLAENVTVQYCIARNGLPVSVADLALGYGSGSGGPFTPAALDGSGCITFGLPGGFALADGHDVTTYFNARFFNGGSYAITAIVVGTSTEAFYAAANLLTQVVSPDAGRSVDFTSTVSGLRVGTGVPMFATLRNGAGAIAGLEQRRLCVSTAPGVAATNSDLTIAYNLDGSDDYPYFASLDAAGCDLIDGDIAGDTGFEFAPGLADEVRFLITFNRAIAYTATLEVRGHASPNTVYARDTLTRTIERGQAQIVLGNLAQPYTGLHIDPGVSVTPNLPYTLDYVPSNVGPTAAGSYAVTALVDTPDWQGSASAALVVSDASGVSLGLAGPALASAGSYDTTYAALLANPGQPTAQPVHTRFTVVRLDDGNADPVTATDVDACVQFGDGDAADCPSGYFSLGFGKTTGSAFGRAAVFLRYPSVPANDAPVPTLAAALNVPLAWRFAPGEYRIVADVIGSSDGLIYASSEVVTSVPQIGLQQTGPGIAAAETALFGASSLSNSGGQLPLPVRLRLRLHETSNAILSPTDAELAWQDGSGFVALSWTQDGPDLVARFTPTGGGLLADGYAATLAERAVFHRIGQFELTAEVVDLAEAQVFASDSLPVEITARGVSITLSDLAQVHDGTPRAVASSTDPAGVAVSLSYSGTTPTVYGPSATPPVNAGSYAISASATSSLYSGTASATLTVAPANASVSLGSLSQGYAGAPRCASVTTNPPGLATSLTYDGSATCPTAAGSHVVVATVTDPNYRGSATGVLTITPAAGATVALVDDDGTVDGVIRRAYSGSSVAAVTATTTPSGLSYAVSYAGVTPTVYPATATPPIAAGQYTVTATTTSPNHVAVQVSGSLVVEPAAAATISIDGASGGALTRSYNGAPQTVTATTADPAGLSYSVSYSGIAPTVYATSPTAPTEAGTYSVVATITDPNHAGSAPATATLTITKATATIAFGAMDFTYDGNPHATTASVAQDATASCSIDYNGANAGNGSAPVDAGEYLLTATCDGTNHAGSASATLLVRRKTLTITVTNPAGAQYTGSPQPASASATGAVPADPATLVVLYDGSATAPTNAGSYNVTAALAAGETNYTATPASGTLVIAKATATVTLGNLAQTFGSVTPVSATPSTSLSGTVVVRYDGSVTVPSAVGSYAVSATIDDPNYTGSAAGTLTIASASASTIAANGSVAASAIAGAPLPGAQPSVRITDGTNPVAGVAVTFAVTAGDGSLTGASAMTDANGVATLASWRLGADPGVQTVRATAAGVSGGVDFTTTSTAEVGLSVSIDDGRGYAQPGRVLNYLVVVGNAGPSNSTGTGLATSLASQFAPGSVTWLCFASGGSSCGASTSGSGALPTSIGIAAGGSVSFLLTATVQASSNEAIVVGVTATPPAGAAGTAANDSDATYLVLFRDGFESGGDGSDFGPLDGEGGSRAGELVAGLDIAALHDFAPRVWLSGATTDGCRFRVEFLRTGDGVYVRLLAAAHDGDFVAPRWNSWPATADLPALSQHGNGARSSLLQLDSGSGVVSAALACTGALTALRAGELQR